MQLAFSLYESKKTTFIGQHFLKILSPLIFCHLVCFGLCLSCNNQSSNILLLGNSKKGRLSGKLDLPGFTLFATVIQQLLRQMSEGKTKILTTLKIDPLSFHFPLHLFSCSIFKLRTAVVLFNRSSVSAGYKNKRSVVKFTLCCIMALSISLHLDPQHQLI